jgi:parvulin-like peptidyl-prolyl isomerase
MAAPSKKSPDSIADGVDEQARLERIKTLWEQLARLNENSAKYNALIREIRKEADAFRKLVEARSPKDQPKD